MIQIDLYQVKSKIYSVFLNFYADLWNFWVMCEFIFVTTNKLCVMILHIKNLYYSMYSEIITTLIFVNLFLAFTILNDSIY